jgi:hypothetical protein
MLDDEAQVVVGVLPAWFRFPNAHTLLSYHTALTQPDLFKPKVFSAQELDVLMGNFNYGVIGRLKPGITAQAALTELNGLGVQLAQLSGQKVALRAVVTPLQETVVGKSRLGLLVLLGAIGTVLLIILRERGQSPARAGRGAERRLSDPHGAGGESRAVAPPGPD